MADDRTPADDETPQEPSAADEQPAAPEQPAPADEPAEQPAAEEPAAPADEPADQPAAEEPAAHADEPAEQPAAEEPAAPEQPAAEEPAAPEQPAAEEPARPAEQPAAAAPAEQPAAQPAAEGEAAEEDFEEDEEPTPRVKPEIPGADLEVDIVMEGSESRESQYDEDEEADALPEEAEDVADDQPIAAVAIDLAAGARYRATGKRKTAVARVILKPGDGSYLINGRSLEVFFPRATLQRNIRQPLEAVGYESRMDVVARMHGGGVSAQAGALRHGISRALLEADPNLRGELKRRGFLTRDPRVKERKKAGLKKARKRPQFSKR
jgi:small subunit ribosomal protein S9